MKVSHVVYLGEVPERNPFSGAENHLLTLLPALAEAGMDVELIAMLWGGTTYGTVLRTLKELEAKGVSVVVVKRRHGHAFGVRHVTFLQAWLVLGRLLSARRDRIVHLHLDYVFTPLVARAAGCRKIVLSVHCDDPELNHRRWRLWLWALDSVVAHYIAITSHVRKFYVEASSVADADITTVYYGVDPPSGASDRQALGIPLRAFVVGYVGRLAEQKNLQVLLEALARRPGVLGVLIGDGPLRARLEDFARVRGIENVRFLGGMLDAAQHMRVFDLFCLPSRFEGLGLVLVEAMLQRVPVAGSRCGAIPEVLGGGAFGLLFDPTADGVTAAIDYAVEHPAEMRTRADLAFDYASTAFSTSRMVAGTAEVYRIVQRHDR